MCALTEKLESIGVKLVETGVVDLDGKLLIRTHPVKRFKKLLENGFNLDGYSIGYSPIYESDLLAKPDPSTLKIYEADGVKIAFMICDLYRDDSPLEYYPRVILRKIMNEIGYDAVIGPELEFYVLDLSGNPIDQGTYMSPRPLDKAEPIKKMLILKALEAGYEVENTHHEVGPSQHEITAKGRTPIEAADDLIFIKYYIRQLLNSHGLNATYMPKPFTGRPGNGLHIHVDLRKNHKRVFGSTNNPTREALSFIAGLLKYAVDISVVTNSTVNSYKRLVKGFEAPVYICWGYGNRSTLIRVPNGRRKAPLRIEYRAPDPLANPYLLFATILLAGVKGIRESLEPPAPIQENVYEKEYNDIETLPGNLKEAVNKSGEIVRDVLGKGYTLYINRKEKEWKDYLAYLEKEGLSSTTIDVTSWEKERYLLF